MDHVGREYEESKDDTGGSSAANQDFGDGKEILPLSEDPVNLMVVTCQGYWHIPSGLGSSNRTRHERPCKSIYQGKDTGVSRTV